MKKFYALAAAAMMALAANAQNGAPLYATGAGGFVNGEWSAANPDEFVYADGVYTMEVTNLTQLKISTVVDPESGNGGWDGFNSGVYGCNYGDTPGVAVTLEAGYTENIATPWKGDYTITVAGDLSTVTLSTETPAPTGPVLVYLRGDMNGWGSPAEWAMTQLSETLYKFTCADDQLIAAGDAFKFADSDWNAINCGGDGNDIDLDVETEVFNGGNPANIKLAEEWDGVVYLDLTPGFCQVYFSNDKDAENPFGDVEGVAGVTVEENAPAVYYNLQGVRVNAPEAGLYIVVKAGKSEKVLVK